MLIQKCGINQKKKMFIIRHSSVLTFKHIQDFQATLKCILMQSIL